MGQDPVLSQADALTKKLACLCVITKNVKYIFVASKPPAGAKKFSRPVGSLKFKFKKCKMGSTENYNCPLTSSNSSNEMRVRLNG